MMRHLRFSRRVVALVSLATCLVLAAAVTAVVFAQSDQTINACKNNKKGALRVVSGPGSCTSKETALSWNKSGPPGPLGPASGAPAFDIANQGFTAWAIGDPGDYQSGSNANPTLVLYRGFTYRFDVDAPGHPFRIASSEGGPAYEAGVTNNDVQNGTITFEVPMDAPDTLDYYCLAHPASMKGKIEIR